MSTRTGTARWIDSAGRWQIVVQHHGVRKTFVSSKPGRTGQREANAKADAWLDGGLLDRTTKTAAAYAQYLERARKTTSESNARPMDSRWRTWVEPRIGRRRVESLTAQSLQDCIDDACAAGLSRKTLKNLRADLSGFVRYCRKAGLTTLILDDDLVIPDSSRTQDKRILQPRDLSLLMSCTETTYRGRRVPDPHVHYYRLAVLTGMRPGELLGLQWRDVHGCEIHLARSVNVLGETTRGKNDNAVRRVPLSDLAAHELEQQHQATGRQAAVFPPIREAILLRHWYRFCDANGISHCTLYELRHTFVSIAQQLPEGQVKAIVGHSQSMDTWGVYAHAVDGQTARTAHALDDIFGELL